MNKILKDHYGSRALFLSILSEYEEDDLDSIEQISKDKEYLKLYNFINDKITFTYKMY